jgi:eukaryotic-like serine/threonine-protein kinase
MGKVVAAHRVDLDQWVAIKFLLPEVSTNPEAVARFASEARAAAKLKGEHVARVFDVGTLESGAPYMVMEYLEGEDLGTCIHQRGALPIAQAADFLIQACDAIAEAHSLGIIHRDLKPSNLFCIRGADGRIAIKVLDFGIAKLTSFSASDPAIATKTTAFMGSPLYMSPEQMLSARDVDSRTDIWALGIVLYELLAGRVPFAGKSMGEIIDKIARRTPEPLSNFRKDVPDGLEAVFCKCTEKERERRYRDAGELGWALLPYAPKSSNAAVERIARIVQSAGFSAKALSASASEGGVQPQATTEPEVINTEIRAAPSGEGGRNRNSVRRGVELRISLESRRLRVFLGFVAMALSTILILFTILVAAPHRVDLGRPNVGVSGLRQSSNYAAPPVFGSVGSVSTPTSSVGSSATSTTPVELPEVTSTRQPGQSQEGASRANHLPLDASPIMTVAVPKVRVEQIANRRGPNVLCLVTSSA